MHILQKHIIDHLRGTKHARYSELQPDYVESSHFKYHLNQLMKDKLVYQHDRGVYGLTEQGITYSDKLSVGRVNPHVTPKLISYTLLYDENNYYLQIKDKEPYRALLNMIGGKIHYGEASSSAARREVYEKTGLCIEEPELCGVAEVTITRKDHILSHVTAYVYRANTSHINANELAQLIAVPKNKELKHEDLAPDLVPLLDIINVSVKPFITSIVVAL